MVLLFITGFLYSLVLKKEFPKDYILVSLKFIAIHFLLSGLIISFVCKTIADNYLRKSEKNIHLPVINSVESMYAFDIHCNSFFPMLVICYITQVRSTLT